MSHTTEIASIVFNDIEALKLTVRDLQRAGVKCTLKSNATPRAYYSTQQGMGVADYVLELGDSPYDVGFYKQDGGKGYVARTDLFAGHVAKVLGSKADGVAEPAQAALGKLYQGYAVNATTRQAAKQGYKVTRSTAADGTVKLIMTV